VIAHRFLPVLVLLLAIALVPTLIHSYAGSVVRDGRMAAALAPTLAGYASIPSSRNATWGQRRFNSDDWIERHYTKGADTVRLTVVRSYDPKSLYHHPELAVAYGRQFVDVKTTQLADRPEMPVHVLVPGPGEEAAAAYVLHYGDRFVSDPIRFQILTSAELLLSRRQAMTLFFALQEQGGGDGLPGSRVSELLAAAVDDFLRQTSVSATSGRE
jgi:hypothetical protein